MRLLESEAFWVRKAGDCRSALEQLARTDPQLRFVVTDLGASEQGGRELGLYLADRLPAVPVLRVVGRPDQSGRLGADDRLGYFLPKPFTAGQFLRAVEMVCGGQPGPRARMVQQGSPTARTSAGRSRSTTLPALPIHRVLADGHGWTDDRAAAQQDIVADGNRACEFESRLPDAGSRGFPGIKASFARRRTVEP